MENQKGAFCISLDFELQYGVSDLENQEKWRVAVRRGREAIPEILSMFSQYGVHASWCTVGMLMATDKQQLQEYVPPIKPKYKNKKLFNYDMDIIGQNEQEDPFHYAGSLLDKIKKQNGQEIGCHSFSHYYCMDEGQDMKSFAADLDSATSIAQHKNILLKSFVFPRNQAPYSYIEAIGKRGFSAYRGTENAFIYSGAESGKESFFKRFARLCDNYFNFSGMNCYKISDLKIIAGVVNVQSSRFFRPYVPMLRLLEPLRIYRIKRQMEYAAKNGMLFHMWWHPHNFGENTDKNLQNLGKILRWYGYLHKKYGMRTMNMAEVATERKNINNKE